MPKDIVRDDATATPTNARFFVEPLERGFGLTLGNALRRTLLSSIQGAAVSAVRIKGVLHELSNIPGVIDDVTDVVLNLKQLVVVMHNDDPKFLKLKVTRQGPIRAGDIEPDADIEIINPELVLCTAAENVEVEMDILIGHGRGYVPGEAHDLGDYDIGLIPLDSNFSPVRKVAYTVENTRVGQRTDYDKLTLEVETNGAIDPADAVARAGQIIDEHMLLFVDQAVTALSDEGIFAAPVDEAESMLDTPIEELELSVRSYNCLKRQGVNTIGQLTECSENDLLNIRNFGAKSIEEVKDKLQQMGLGLKQ
jgi:DNA-directed RNA polymerase subunit alpha